MKKLGRIFDAVAGIGLLVLVFTLAWCDARKK